MVLNNVPLGYISSKGEQFQNCLVTKGEQIMAKDNSIKIIYNIREDGMGYRLPDPKDEIEDSPTIYDIELSNVTLFQKNEILNFLKQLNEKNYR